MNDEELLPIDNNNSSNFHISEIILSVEIKQKETLYSRKKNTIKIRSARKEEIICW